MSDINLLSTAPSSGKDGKAAGGPSPLDDELKLHVPDALPPETKPAAAVKAVPDPEVPEVPEVPVSLFSQKLTDLPPATVPIPARPAQPSVPPPPVPAPVLPPRLPDDRGGDTLRVSLITSGAGAGMSELALRRRLRTFLVVGALGLVSNGLIFAGLRYWRSTVERRNTQAEQSVRDVDALIASHEAKLGPIRDFQGLARTAAAVLKNHAHWTRVLELLEERALPNVQFGGLAGADTGTLSFEVRAADYTTLARQIVAFREDPRVLKVVVGTAAADFGENALLRGTRASMTLTVDPAIFDYRPASPAVPTAP